MIREYDTNVETIPMQDTEVYYAIKRLMDISIAIILLILLSPLFLLIILFVKIFSPGPVFFAQERVSAIRVRRDGNQTWSQKNFLCYKFRSMSANASQDVHKAYINALIENDEEQMIALQGGDTGVRKLTSDSRITRPGKLLRKLSLDELPQLLNVAKGEMSLVGPRPAIPYEVEMYKPWHYQRLNCKPGLTGLQQIEARGSGEFDEQVRLDIQYIENKSLWLDIKIILKTPLVVLSTKGAH